MTVLSVITYANEHNLIIRNKDAENKYTILDTSFGLFMESERQTMSTRSDVSCQSRLFGSKCPFFQTVFTKWKTVDREMTANYSKILHSSSGKTRAFDESVPL
jgi:hypothetical protein